MPPTECPSRPQLDSFQAGVLDEPLLASLGSHVESCSTCQQVLETVVGECADPVLAALLSEPEISPFAAESACREAVQRATALTSVQAGAEITLASAHVSNRGGSESAAGDLPIESIREYKLLAKLGEGGMGAVYKALHTRLDKTVALKILPADRMRDGGAVARFQREMKAVGRLDHPNIVRAMDAGEEGGMHFLVMEYVEGLDLSQLAKSIGPLQVADACELVRQAALGLAEAHEHGMVHRDIKPSNLILAQPKKKKGQPTVKILDLGLALLSEALAPDHQGLTTSGQMMGTIDYMAPEQGGDSHQVDIRADIYSLGATLYRLLTGAPPFAGDKFDTPVKKLTALATQSPASIKLRRPEISAPLAAIVERMLAKNPAARFATPEELVEALAPFCAGADLGSLSRRAVSAVENAVPGVPNRGKGALAAETATHARSSPSGDTAPTIDRAVGNAVPGVPGVTGVAAGVNRRAHAAKSDRKIPRSLAIATACGGLALAVLLGVIFFLQTPDGTVRIEINDSKIKVVIDHDGNATFTGADKHHNIVLKPGPHGLAITRDGFTFGTTSFELKKNEKPVLKIDYFDGKGVVVTKDGKLLPAPAVITVSNAGWHGWPADAPPPAIAPFDAAQAKQHQAAWAKYLGVPVEWENSIGMKFRLIPPGEFLMGSTPEEIEAAILSAGSDEGWKARIRTESPQHRVVIRQPIFLGIHEVTQAQYEQVVRKNPSYFAATGMGRQEVTDLDTQNHPVEMVSWNDAADFSATLSQMEQLKPCYIRAGETINVGSGNGYRLPTEAQWEFACRAGTTTKYSTGNSEEDLAKAGWIAVNSDRKTHPTGELNSNPFGLFDIHGNVCEWCADYYDEYRGGVALDPSGPDAGIFRVLRLGSWDYLAPGCRSACRYPFDAKSRNLNMGFRIALPAEVVKLQVESHKGLHLYNWPADAPSPASAPFDAEQAKQHQKAWATYLGLPVEHTNSIGMKFVLIPPGEFTMGSTPEDIERDVKSVGPSEPWIEVIRSEAPQHHVILTQPIYLGVHEVTQWQYERIMERNPSHFSAQGAGKDAVSTLDTRNHPVEKVSAFDATRFCEKLSEQEGFGALYRLPTEAHWEFACRAGATTKYWTGDERESILDAAWCKGNSNQRTHKVGELMPNAFGLFDINGNVWEWVADAWEADYYGRFRGQPAVDPSGPAAGGARRVVRGGSWDDGSGVCRCSSRLASDPTSIPKNLGFRVALSVESVRQALAKVPPRAIAPFDAAQAKQHQKAWAKHLGVPVEYENSLGMKFVLIPPGEFTMGSAPGEIEQALKFTSGNAGWRKSEAPQHRVILTQPIYLGVHEVTQAEYEHVMAKNPSSFAPNGTGKDAVAGLDTTSHPVEMVSWDDAAEFCAKLSEQESLKTAYSRSGETGAHLTGTGYRLPTEAEWEFACRGGTTTPYWVGNKDEDLSQAAWLSVNAGNRTHEVGQLQANPLGLYDVHANVWEWIQDWWQPTYYEQFEEKPALDPTGPLAGSRRVLRGGAWNYNPSGCRAGVRYANVPTHRNFNIGFRVALSVEAVKELTTAPAGNALRFSKDSKEPDLSAVRLPTRGPWTVEGWFTPRDPLPGKNEAALIFMVDPCWMSVRDSSQGVKWALGGPVFSPPPTLYSDAKVVPGEAAHVALTREPEGVVFFINGEKQGEPLPVALSGPDKPLRLCLAGNPSRRDVPYQGDVDEVRVSSIIRYRDNFTPKKRFEPDADTLALYHFDEGHGDELKDSSGNNRHGKITGAKWVPLTGAKPQDVPPAIDQVVDLLKLVDVDRDAVKGKWTLTPAGLASDGSVPYCRLKLPYAPPAEYDFRVEFTAQGGNDILQLLTAGGHDFTWLMGAWGGRHDGFDTVKDHPLTKEGTNIIGGPTSIRRGQRHTSIIQVRRDSITATIDGKQVVRHATDGSDLGIPSEWSIGEGAIGLGTTFDAVVFHKVELIVPGAAGDRSDEASVRPGPTDVPPALERQEPFTNSLGMKFVLIPKGESWLGGGGGTPGEKHVEFSEDFFLGSFEVTQAEWLAVTGLNPSQFRGVEGLTDEQALRLPVEKVSWDDAQLFLQRLNARDKQPGWIYRLPTEEEWEYACRGSPRSDMLDSGFHYYLEQPTNEPPVGQINYSYPESIQRTNLVGSYPANPLGLFDMHGNVWEWCQDEAPPDPTDESPGPRRAMRGGSWNSNAESCQAAHSYGRPASFRGMHVGLRLARVRATQTDPMPPATPANE